MSNAVIELARYFTGPVVAAHSMGLGAVGAPKIVAEEFFKAREACGIRGYASPDEAVAAIKRTLERAATDA